ANELGIVIAETPAGKTPVAKMVSGMRSVQALLKVQRVFDERSFDTGARKGKVKSFVAGDETGTIRVVAWNDQVDKIQTLKEGDIVLIDNAYTKENNNQKEMHLNDKSKLELNPPGETIGSVKATVQQRLRKKIESLQENDANVEVLGTIVQAFEPRYFEVCPFCNKRAKLVGDGEFICEAHGKVAQKYSYVMNAVIDDGSNTIRTVFFKNQAENLTGKSETEFVSMRDRTDLVESMKNELLGEIVKVVGRVNKNTVFNRLEFVSQLVFRNPNPDEEIKQEQ
ncbi:MAG TPA: OB-fold nucleic acid binding domain-containing protein, partial [Candidatus Nanoarchaeia archaeon]|nr:OB-fold nucleic acid binding domain-containing protein [Candidatus Nanoarchaeia archaeon]